MESYLHLYSQLTGLGFLIFKKKIVFFTHIILKMRVGRILGETFYTIIC